MARIRFSLVSFVFVVMYGRECRNLIFGCLYFFPVVYGSERKDFRNADTVEVTNEEFAKRIWKRVEPYVKKEVTISEVGSFLLLMIDTVQVIDQETAQGSLICVGPCCHAGVTISEVCSFLLLMIGAVGATDEGSVQNHGSQTCFRV